MGFIDHPSDKIGSKLWNPQHASRCSNLFRCYAKHISPRKEGHHTFVIHRDFIWVNPRQVLQFPNHGRIIMPQHIEFEDVLIDIVEVKVSRLPFSRHVIRWILDRRKVVYIHVVRNNNNSPGVLSCCPLDTSRPLSKTFHLCITIKLAIISLVTLDKSISGLGSHRTNRSCTEGIFLTKDITHIQMGTRLVFSRKVQVNIGNLVPIKTKEGLERNILPIFTEFVTTFRTVLIGHIKSRTVRTICDKLTILTLTTDIVRRERIDLCNPNHGRNETGANRPTRTHQVTPLIGTLH